MEKKLENIAKAVAKVFYGVGWVYCALLPASFAAFADEPVASREGAAEAVSAAPAEGDAAPAAVPAQPAGAAEKADDAAAQPIDERIELSRKVRQLHNDWIKARAKASADDPEIDRIAKRIAALEGELSRARTEMDGRISAVPAVRAAKEALDAAQKQLDDLNAKSRASGVRGRRVIRRKPDEVNRRRAYVEGAKPAVEEVQQEAGGGESATGSGE